ncbi:MAG: hypothetical protein RBT69_06250 [Spirochaetia bacterium]|jgi:hypothetical protein|nr:hypothetical protein [Spirochaetia bacterium]
MKKTIISAIAFFIILAVFTGCAGSPAPSAEPENNIVQVNQEISSPEPAKIIVPILLSETKYQRMGYVDTKTVNTYKSGSSRLIQSTTYDNAGVVLETASAEYSNNSSLLSWYDRDNNLLKKKKITTDNKGNVIETILFENTGKQVSRSLYKYEGDNSKKTKWEIFDSSDILLGYNEYIYENGNNVRTDSYSPAGVLEEYFTYKYANNMMTDMSHYNKSGKKISGSIYKYNKDNLIASEIIYKGEKSIINEIIYEYSEEDGKRTETSIIKTPKGDVVEIVEKVFAFIEKEQGK